MLVCSTCRRQSAEGARFCSHCGEALPPSSPSSDPGQTARKDDLNLTVLIAMAGLLLLAVLIPPWEASPEDPPAFLGFHPFWASPTATAVVSRMLLTIETTTIAIAGIYGSWFFRKRRDN